MKKAVHYTIASGSHKKLQLAERMLTEATVNKLLKPFELGLTSQQVGQISTYLEMLLRWNERINLTALRTGEECVTRHFGESLYLSRWVELRGRLLDIGSGAGFPGLALKIVFPSLSTTLLEPVAKKRAFLKEVARTCGMTFVEVRPDRLEVFARSTSAADFDAATARAVGPPAGLALNASRCLKPGGRLCLWISKDQGRSISRHRGLIEWAQPIEVPLSQQREIWIGTRTEDPMDGRAIGLRSG